jgi:hypothetical protein
MLEMMQAEAAAAKAKKEAVKTQQERKAASSFGSGFKKGFFNSSQPVGQPAKKVGPVYRMSARMGIGLNNRHGIQCTILVHRRQRGQLTYQRSGRTK